MADRDFDGKDFFEAEDTPVVSEGEAPREEADASSRAVDTYSADGGFSGDSFRSYEEEPKEEAHSSPVREARYEEIFDSSRPKSRGFSVASLVLGILSVICCCFGWGGLVLGILAIVFAVISRTSLKYFDGMTIAGLILGIFGTVFGIATLFLMYGPIAEALEEIMKELENMPPEDLGTDL